MFIKSLKRKYKNFSHVLAASDIRTAMKIYTHLALIRDPESRMLACMREKMNYLEHQFAYLINRYQDSPHINGPNEGPIWFCWWQGKDGMPPIVKKCYTQLLQMAPPSHPVALITQNNIGNYLTLPDYILSLVQKKHITLTHFSDILRASLLYEHGGLWIDSTVFVARPIEEEWFSTPYFSGKAPYDSKFINRCLYTGFLIGSVKNAPWFHFLQEFLYDYWKSRTTLLDYLLIDYALMLAYDHIPSIREDVRSGIMPTEHIHTLEAIRNDPYHEERYKEMVQTCPFFKMSYKLPSMENTKDGKLTYYGHLLQS